MVGVNGRPALKLAGIEGRTTLEITRQGKIREDMFRLLGRRARLPARHTRRNLWIGGACVLMVWDEPLPSVGWP
jgi:hypothetical protein